jgi:hypothetical protein
MEDGDPPRQSMSLVQRAIADAGIAAIIAHVVALILASLQIAGITSMTIAIGLLVLAWFLGLVGSFICGHIWKITWRDRAIFSVIFGGLLGSIGYLENRLQNLVPTPIPFPTFSEIYAGTPKLGTPQSQIIIAHEAAIFVHEHAIILWADSLHHIIMLNTDNHASFQDYEDKNPETRADRFDDNEIRKVLGDTFPKDPNCKPPRGGVVERWKNSAAWRAMGCRLWWCAFSASEISYQKFDNGYVFSAFPDAPGDTAGRFFYIDRMGRSWSYSGHVAPACSDPQRSTNPPAAAGK